MWLYRKAWPSSSSSWTKRTCLLVEAFETHPEALEWGGARWRDLRQPLFSSVSDDDSSSWWKQSTTCDYCFLVGFRNEDDDASFDLLRNASRQLNTDIYGRLDDSSPAEDDCGRCFFFFFNISLYITVHERFLI